MLYSDRRDDGLLLESMIATRPKHPLIPKLVRGLLDHRTAGHWENTQENCWVLLAIDRYFHQYESVTPNLDLKQKLLRLDNTKAGEVQFVRLNSIALEVLEEVLASHDGPWLFPGKNGQMDGSAVSRRFHRLMVKLELKEASWHTLRHTFISRMAMLGTPLPTLQNLARTWPGGMGHGQRQRRRPQNSRPVCCYRFLWYDAKEPPGSEPGGPGSLPYRSCKQDQQDEQQGC